MQFSPLSKPPNAFTPCLIRRDLVMPLKYGVRERRSEIVISFWTGRHWLNREEHWKEWMEIPPENHSVWIPGAGMLPEKDGVPVLVILPQPINLVHMVIPAGLHFGLTDTREWRIYQRQPGARVIEDEGFNLSRQWVSIGKYGVSSWMKLPKLNLNAKLRSD